MYLAVLCNNPGLERGVQDGRRDAGEQAAKHKNSVIVDVLGKARCRVDDGEEQAVVLAATMSHGQMATRK